MARKKPRAPADAAAQDGHFDRSNGAPHFPIIGIGASAGGIQAFREMLEALPVEAGLAYVFVLHMPADHESFLSEILARGSTLPVGQVSQRTFVEPNRVYVLPPGSDVEVEDGSLALSPRTAQTGHHRPIDHFFRSLAEHRGPGAIGIVLSGTGSDGAIGVQEIKAAGGITFAQDDTAQQNSMPRSAIQTGAVDFVLRPLDIARELGRIAGHAAVALAPAGHDEDLPDLSPVLAILRESSGVDFTDYKQSTLYRRILRRVVLHKLDGIPQYMRVLESDPREAEALYQDILINVTSFFRNPEAFDALKAEVFPALCENRSRHDPVRIWTLGCSTGEEAYSLAIAFTEFAEGLGRAVSFQVFATDLNAASIDKARLGIYPAAALAEMSEERVRRFFAQIDGSFRIAKSIRDACIFARHNVLQDPPFSRIDLVSCRNMLIYLGSGLQEKVIPVLHYALRPSGYLWLGTSETIGPYRDLFDIRNTRYKIYAKKVSNGQVVVPAQALRDGPPRGAQARFPSAEAAPPDVNRDVERMLVARYAPPSVLIRGDMEILHYRGNTSPYLTPAAGKPTFNLLKMLREGLVLGVRAAVQRARTDEAPVRQEGLTYSLDGIDRKVNVEVVPLKTDVQRAEAFMVIFEDASAALPPREQHAAAPPTTDETDQETARIKQELAATREYLQSVIEQQEAANEELQSANEEVQSANEELQSINEELETSKEEVQSSNEELSTVNDELGQVNNDLVNLLASVQLPIVMLGPSLRIRRFTPMAEKMLNLIPTDIGRPVSDIKMNLNLPDLDRLVVEAMDEVAERELEVQDKQGRWWMVRVRPYRTLENKIDGAVVVLVDVDALKRSQQILQRQAELLEQVHQPIFMWDLDGGVTYWNKAAEDAYGFTRDQALGRKPHELLLAEPAFEAYIANLTVDEHWGGEVTYTRRDGFRIIVESRMVVVTDPKGRKLVVQADRPITARKESERLLQDRADGLAGAARETERFLAVLGHELRNPLAPLMNALQALKDDRTAAGARQRAVGIMERQVQRMSRLVGDLLDVSHATLAQLELRREPLDLVKVARQASEQQGTLFEEKQQTLRTAFPDEALVVHADEVRLEQIVANLLHNASRYTGTGGEIRVSVERRGDDALLRVRDNGRGMSPELLERVFDLFVRGDSLAGDGGLGIGLTLVRHLVELHGGRVDGHSAGEGKGSEFVVALPLAR